MPFRLQLLLLLPARPCHRYLPLIHSALRTLGLSGCQGGWKLLETQASCWLAPPMEPPPSVSEALGPDRGKPKGRAPSPVSPERKAGAG